MNLAEVIEEFRSAATAFAQGNPEPVKALFSHADDVSLANPFGPAVRGWDNVSAALDYASSRFSDGLVSDFNNVVSYVGADLATYLDTERWHTRVGGGELADFELRVTTTFRSEEGEWKIVHRHADPGLEARPRRSLAQSVVRETSANARRLVAIAGRI